MSFHAATAKKAGSPDKPIRIAGIKVQCYVLEDDRRVIATNGVLDALQMARGGAMVKGMNRLELFAAQNRLKDFVSNELLGRIADPIRFRVGNNVTHGFESDTLIELAEAEQQPVELDRALFPIGIADSYLCVPRPPLVTAVQMPAMCLDNGRVRLVVKQRAGLAVAAPEDHRARQNTHSN